MRKRQYDLVPLSDLFGRDNGYSSGPDSEYDGGHGGAFVSGPEPRQSWLSRLLAAVTVSAVGGAALAAVLVPFLAVPVLGARNAADYWNDLPSTLPKVDLPQQSYLLASDGTRIATLFDEDRVPVHLKDVSLFAQQAVVAIEDSRFYQHSGVDYKGILRAAANNSGGAGVRQGASTLTQQYVKNVLLVTARSAKARDQVAGAHLERKIREARYALGVEKTMTKAQILEGYLNIAYFADGAYGIGTAAQHYFSVPASQLTLGQAALLAGLVKDPTRYNPAAHPRAATARRATVLQRMADLRYITQTQAHAAAIMPLGLKLKQATNGCLTSPYPFFCTWVRQAIRNDPAFGATEEARKQALFTGGLTIRTSLDPRKQAAAQAAVDRALSVNNRIAGAVVTVQPGTGAVVAMATNRRFGTGPGKTQVILPVVPAFQPGSTFKAFTLATALTQGIPPTVTFNAPNQIVIPGRNSPPGGFGNAGDSEAGVYAANQATWRSVNTWYVQLEDRTGVLAVADTAARLGITSLPRTGPRAITEHDASLTLGTYEVSPLEMAEAYAAFAAHGIACHPVGIIEVTDRYSRHLPVPDAHCHEAVTPAVADTMANILQGTIDGPDAYRTGKGATIGRPAAGKTGTTQSFGAAWFNGFTPDLATAVWIGDPRGPSYPLLDVESYNQTYPHVYGGDIPASIWSDAMKNESVGIQPHGFAPIGATAANSVPLTVPDVRGLLGLQAQQVLLAAGFVPVVHVAPVQAGLPTGRASSTSPEAGATAVPGQQVIVTVRGGPPQATDGTGSTSSPSGNPGGSGNPGAVLQPASPAVSPATKPSPSN